ncbi:type II toxin-antitoxin system RelE family toxin [Anaerococcus marasmi]|uniref:type II toxin-antitoxin system RelE family toxin n=1 Tax=Anaerococcus marasmi TaxID=2057797 RepID=UPI000CFA50F9|nr:type II toxin-antitoxin system RelE/ParE family toxin [Anaerococcus marasmi]
MTYRLVITADVKKKIKKMDKHLGLMLARDMKSKLDDIEDPRSIGKALQGEYKGLWRYRIGSYRVICEIRDYELIVLAIDVGHRKDIYRR